MLHDLGSVCVCIHFVLIFRLMQDMQTVYASTEEVVLAWKEGDHCAAEYSEDHLWYRARIVSVNDDAETATVCVPC